MNMYIYIWYVYVNPHPRKCVSKNVGFHTAYLCLEYVQSIFTKTYRFSLHLSLLPFQICSTKGPLLCLHSNGWRYFLPQPTWRTHGISKHGINQISVKYCSPYPTSEMPQNQRVVYTIMDHGFQGLKTVAPSLLTNSHQTIADISVS